MRIYISGKIGEEVISDATRAKFARAERMLMAKWYRVFNPADPFFNRCIVNAARRAWDRDKEQAASKGDWEWDKPLYDYILLEDLNTLHGCDAIYMLADWEESDGANVELDFARATGKRIFWEREEDAQLNSEDFNNYEDAWLPIDEKEGEV